MLESNIKCSCQASCLEALRILSRDKKVLDPVATKQNILALMRLAGLEYTENAVKEMPDFAVIVEALKCLCNIIFNSKVAQQLSVDLRVIVSICQRLQMYKDQNLSHEIKFFDLRLLFLLSAFQTDIRVQIRDELRGLQLLTDVLDYTLGLQWVDKYEVATQLCRGVLTSEEVDLMSEVLKALFNVTMDSSHNINEDSDHQFRHLAAILRHCLMLKADSEDRTEELQSHAINLLSNIPISCLDVLISVPSEAGSKEHNGENMEAVQVLLDFMEKRIDKGSSLKEGVTPVLSLMIECSRTYSSIRRYLKAKVLPPLKDLSNRPEVGTTTRNKLVRLMTHVDTGVKQTAAEFLFVLCKERVDNLLKYTGYGNAAGLLASRSLLAGGRGEGQYSDSDEDSDTEEYKSAKPYINPITGHVEEPLPNPMDEMTEEQKEYEALKLVNMFDKLSRKQIIMPMTVTPGGTMAPIEEMLHNYSPPENESSESD
ncbi:synembryn-B isoform X2 [Protopterus annectens]|nr:synembryn-B isoform X2 [Protopterus annectens]